jgi:hypothetical protein
MKTALIIFGIGGILWIIGCLLVDTKVEKKPMATDLRGKDDGTDTERRD